MLLLLPALLLACSPDKPGSTGSDGGDTGGGDSGASGDERITLGEVQPCERPGEVSYWEQAEPLGLPPGPDLDADHLVGGGAAVEDLDGDGDLDLALTWEDQATWQCVNESAAFACTPLSALGQQLDGGGPLALGDLTGDGLPDLVVGGTTPVLLEATATGLQRLSLLDEHVSDRLGTPAAADLDGDGDVDLYLPLSGAEDAPDDRQDVVLWNDGGGRFTAAGAPAAEATGGMGVHAVHLDWQGDGDPDLYVVNDVGVQYGADGLLDNQDGALADGTTACACGVSHGGAGAHVADRNGDGHPDLLLTASGELRLLDSDGAEGLVDVSRSTRAHRLLSEGARAWGGVYLDFDNDGDLDILAAEGDRWEAGDERAPVDSPVHLWAFEDGEYREAGGALGLSPVGSHRAVVPADLNGDGVLDLLVTDVVDRARLYLSETCTAAGWLAVRAPVGSRVEVELAGETRTAWISHQSGFAGAGPAVAWFGLGEAQAIDGLTVTLPWTGEELALTGPLDARRTVTVTP